jgi:hypothetical protein
MSRLAGDRIQSGAGGLEVRSVKTSKVANNRAIPKIALRKRRQALATNGEVRANAHLPPLALGQT